MSMESAHGLFRESSFKFIASLTATHALADLVEGLTAHEEQRSARLLEIMDVPSGHRSEIVEISRWLADTAEKATGGKDGPGERYTYAFDDPAVEESFVRVLLFWKTFQTESSSATMLQNSLLVTMVGAFEVQVSDALRAAMVSNPAAMNAGKLELTYERIQLLGSFDAIVSDVVERSVDAVMRAGRRSWAEWMDSRKVGAARDVLKSPELDEVMERRHAIVHNSGCVTATYGAVLDKRGQHAELGSVIEINKDYMSEAFQVLLAAGTVVVVDCWKKFADTTRSTASAHIQILLERFAREKWWKVVARLGEYGQEASGPTGYECWLYKEWANKEMGNGLGEWRGQAGSYPSDERVRLDRAILAESLVEAQEIMEHSSALSDDERRAISTRAFYRITFDGSSQDDERREMPD